MIIVVDNHKLLLRTNEGLLNNTDKRSHYLAFKT